MFGERIRKYELCGHLEGLRGVFPQSQAREAGISAEIPQDNNEQVIYIAASGGGSWRRHAEE